MDYVTTKQAAELLGITQRAVQKLIERERLAAVKMAGVYLVLRKDVKAFKRLPPGAKAKK